MGYKARTEAQIALDAEARAVEEGHRAFVQQDGSIKIISDTDSSKSYRVTFFEVPYLEGLIHFTCSCLSGQNRQHIPLPCKHSALAGRRLIREKLAVWSAGLFYVSDKARKLAVQPSEEDLDQLQAELDALR